MAFQTYPRMLYRNSGNPNPRNSVALYGPDGSGPLILECRTVNSAAEEAALVAADPNQWFTDTLLTLPA